MNFLLSIRIDYVGHQNALRVDGQKVVHKNGFSRYMHDILVVRRGSELKAISSQLKTYIRGTGEEEGGQGLILYTRSDGIWYRRVMNRRWWTSRTNGRIRDGLRSSERNARWSSCSCRGRIRPIS